MSDTKKIIDSFSIRDSLNPKVWKNPTDPEKAVMVPKVRQALLRIAEEFIDYLGDDIFVDDIVLTGSLANFNWSEYSDFDLHIHIDLEQFEKDSELYKELFDLKKFIFNQRHNIKIYGYDVELYAQDIEEPHVASGVYSVMNDEWLTKPKKVDFELDKKVLTDKIKCWTEKIDKAVESETTEDEIDVLENLRKKLKEYRKSGLDKEGELSYENLVFKFLRRSGHIQRLFDSAHKAVDKQLSVEKVTEQ
jgi:predicted nucleotidyltransferase